ncbi:MAG: zinc-binding dehydrogenase [Capsulimonadaceae bacterium]|nr:zinc-binding dehydrogenase [Capsulimonadaceae bacterium]
MSRTMTALVNFAAAPYSVDLREAPIPSIGEDDVLLRVAAVGVCGSDLHQYHGSQSWKVNYPVILGHEFAGTVVETGARATAFHPGDRVVSETAAVINPASPFVRSGAYNLDPARLGFGYGVDGAMTEYVRVPERCLHRLPDSLAFETASLTEPCCVAYNATCVQSPIHPGASVAVIGPGPIGLLCAMMAHLAGASPLIVIGMPQDAKRLAVARAIGATRTFDVSGDELLEAVRATGDGYGVDVVIDAAGVSAALQTALAIVRPAGHITKVGWGPKPLGFNMDPLVQKAVTLQGSFSHNWPMWERVIGMLASGQLDLTPVLSAVRPLDKWEECFAGMQSGEMVKAVLTPAA